MTFKEALKILALVLLVILCACLIFVTCSKKASVPPIPQQKEKEVVAEKVVAEQPKPQCQEHVFCGMQHQAAEIKRTVTVVEEVLPLPPPCGVQEITIGSLTVQNTQIINNEIVEPFVPECQAIHVIPPKAAEEQDALIQYEDRRSGNSYEVRSSYYGGGYYSGGWNGGGGSGWNSQNARVHQGTPHNWQQNTQCGRRVR